MVLYSRSIIWYSIYSSYWRVYQCNNELDSSAHFKPTEKVLKGNKELEKYQEPEEYQQTNCIGFQIPSDDEYYYDEDDE